MSTTTTDTNHHSHVARPRSVVVVSGNPRTGSRTLTVGQTLGDAIRAGLTRPALHQTIEIADFGPEIFASERPRTNGSLSTIRHADVLIVATPVYKATYTGLLKLFLDQLPPEGLQGVVAIPVIVSASPAHSLAAELHLRPLLIELGASLPTRSLTVTEAELPDLPQLVTAWWTREAGPLLRAVAIRAGA